MAAPKNLSQMKRALSLCSSFLHKEPSPKFLPSTSSIFTSAYFYRRGFQTGSKSVGDSEDGDNDKTGVSDPVPAPEALPSEINSNRMSSPSYSVVSNLKTSERHDLAMVFTCKVCETRSVKTANRESYEKGVVVARCDGCNNLHLIADRLGWFGEPGSIEDFLAARGEEVKKGSADTLNLTLDDLAGKKLFKE